MISDLGTPVRRAALLLHAMAPADRDWMLRQLPGDENARLQELLRELAELGIPHDRTLLKQVLAAPGPAPAPVREPTLGAQTLAYEQPALTPRETLDAANPARLALVLREEPVELVAMLLALQEWSWREAFLRHLGPLRSGQVQERLAAGHTADRAGTASERMLLAAVLRRLSGLPAEPLTPAAVRALPAAQARKRITLSRNWFGQVFGPLVRGQGR